MIPIGIKLAALVPHPPVVVPDVGREQAGAVSATAQAMQQVAERIVAEHIETLVLITPHGPYGDSLPVIASDQLVGDLRRFGGDREYRFGGDAEVVEAFRAVAEQRGLPVSVVRSARLDHGSIVPLHFVKEAGAELKLVIIGMTDRDPVELIRYGRALRDAIELVGRQAAVVASGDLSHSLTKDAPAGYHPSGQRFDQLIGELFGSGDVQGLINMDRTLIAEAAQCGYGPLLIMSGAAPGKGEVVSYEGPFGVGYMVAIKCPPSLPVQVAAEALNRAIAGLAIPDDHEPPSLSEPRAVFVSLKERGHLRGCIGAIDATRRSAYREIQAMAVEAAISDPRFPQVTAEELSDLEISVDVLEPLERVRGIEDLDPQRYGIVVQKGYRRGVLLPDLPEVRNSNQQFEIACGKAGINPEEEGITVYRFKATRYR